MNQTSPVLVVSLTERHSFLTDYLADIGYRLTELDPSPPTDTPRMLLADCDVTIAASTAWYERLREGLVGALMIGDYAISLGNAPLRPDVRLASDSTGREVATAIRLVDELIKVRQANQEEREECQRWMTLAMQDPLTGLPNRRGWDMSLAEHLAYPETICVAMLDVDLFKQINDLAGYQVGDCVLREVGQVLRSHLRAADVVARLGGDEFGIILRGVSRRPAAAVLERLRFEVTQHLKSRKLPAASLSAGYVVISRSRRGHAQDVFAAAAMSLQAAKQQVRPGGGTPLLPKPNPR